MNNAWEWTGMRGRRRPLTDAIEVTPGWRDLIAAQLGAFGRVRGLAGLLLVVSFGSGCAESVEVTGQVSYQGKPVEEGTIQFRPEQGRAVSALITDGRYAIDGEETLQPGGYRVRVFAQRETGRMVPSPDRWSDDAPTSAPEYVQVLPERYNTQTTLSATVVAGSNSLDFRLD